MKRFLIHVSTYWCGMDDTFRAVAESEMELWDLAEQLAYDNFQSYSCENDIAEEEGYDRLDHCIQYVVDHCGEYLTQWVPAEEYHLSWQLEEMAIYPLADFILKDDGAWEDFVDFFTSEKETASGTPYIDCYDIRELFENGDV